MINWKPISYLLLGFGGIILLYGLFTFLDTFGTVRINPLLSDVAFTTALHEAQQPFLISALLFVGGFVCLYMERDSENYAPSNEKDLLERLDRLEDVVDNNFTVINKRLDRIEEKESMTSQNTIIKAKREQ